jgi:hypothetical protein
MEDIKDKGKKIIQTSLNVSSPIASALSLINPAFLAIPIIASVCNELCAFFDAKSVEKRLLEFQKKIEEQKLTIQELQNNIDLLNEHEQYVFRNNIKYLCLEALPETTGLLIDCLISYITNEKQDMDEELCEIVCSFNANDIELLKIIKQYMVEGGRVYHQQMIDKYYSDVKEMQTQSQIKQQESHTIEKRYIPHKWHDRNIIYGTNTIFWKDFTDFYGLTNISDMGRMLNETGRNEDGIEVYDWAFLIRSLLKMQSKGVAQLEFVASLGVISQNNIERFHITLFGQNLLEHIALDN